VLCADARPRTAVEVEAEERVAGPCARLTGENIHGVPRHGSSEVAACGRKLSAGGGVGHGFPSTRAVGQGDSPHVVETRVSVVAGKDVEETLVYGGSVS